MKTLFILTTLMLTVSAQSIISSNFRIQANREVSLNQNETTFLISSSKTIDELQCIAECNRNSDCATVVYSSDKNNDNCLIYERYFHKTDTKVSTINSQIYEKNCKLVNTFGDECCIRQDQDLVKALSTYKLRFRLNNADSVQLTDVHSIGIYSYNGLKLHYVILVYSNNIFIFDDSWHYLYSKIINEPAFMIQIEDELIVSSNNAIYRTDKDLNILGIFNVATNGRNLVYSKSNNRIYIAGYNNLNIYVLSRNLTLISTIFPLGYKPFSIGLLEDILFVGTINGNVMKIHINGTILSTISLTLCTGDWLHKINTDYYGRVAVECYNNNKIVVLHSNLTSTGVTFSTASSPRDVIFDSDGRVIVAHGNGIDIYY